MSENSKLVVENSKIKVHYTGKFVDGQVFDSSKAVEGYNFETKEPLEVVLGEGKLIPGFEKALQGMSEGEVKTVSITCDEAYGQPREELIEEVEKQYLPETVAAGQVLHTQNAQGQQMTVVVVEVKENSALLDANHPLSGKDLVFDLELVSVE